MFFKMTQLFLIRFVINIIHLFFNQNYQTRRKKIFVFVIWLNTQLLYWQSHKRFFKSSVQQSILQIKNKFFMYYFVL